MVSDVRPEGATPAYAPPEVLRSLQQQYEGAEWDDALVNGPSADWWSVGVVLFFLLTGDLPFSDEGPVVKEAPVTVPSHCRAQWQDYQRVLEEQQIWVSVCSDSSDGMLCTYNRHRPHLPLMCSTTISADMRVYHMVKCHQLVMQK